MSQTVNREPVVLLRLETVLELQSTLRVVYEWVNTQAQYSHPKSEIKKLRERFSKLDANIRTDIEYFKTEAIERNKNVSNESGMGRTMAVKLADGENVASPSIQSGSETEEGNRPTPKQD